ncbi:uncharacterized protein LOC124530459 [Vanessa cardui]|uniref:uncharacterized protein LOC124530459 n=1 Tax=Vanessa cardui TaxID=171605 RepID=UPI001F13A71D|nr:uncharacterized protein LOC124530459 [Vanessa cardui]
MLLIPEISLHIQILLQTIVTNYLNSSNCITVVSENALLFNLPNSFMYLDANNTDDLANLMLNASEMGCSDYIVQINDPEIFMIAFEKVVHMGNVRRSDRKVIMLPVQNKHIASNNSDKNLINILSMKEVSFVANILLIVPSDSNSGCDTYDLITHKFVGPDDNNKPVCLDKWNSCTSKFEKNANLFPHNMSNLYGKIVKVAGFTYTPYVLLDLDSTTPLGRDGIEVRIVDEFCRWINCTVEIVRDDEHEWGEIYDNLTGVGVIGNVFEDRADLGITALYSWYEEYVVMDFSAPFLRTGITCVAPSPRLLASWEMPLLPFSLYMWIGLFFTFIYASLALIVAKGFVADDVFLTTFGIMITQSQPESGFSSWRIRSVVGWMMMTGLVLDNAYGGGLASTFTVPKYEPTIDTIQDIVDRKLTWGATHDAWIFSLILSQEPLIRNLLSLFRTYPAEELNRRSFTRNMAFSIEKLPAENFAIGNYITKEALLDLTIMIEEFYAEQCVVMMRKSSMYTNKLSDLIGRLHETGLLLAWETQIALRYLDYKVQLEVKLSRSKRDVENVEPLALRHVEGVFIIYAIGIILSFLTFVVEIFIHRKKTKKLRRNSGPLRLISLGYLKMLAMIPEAIWPVKILLQVVISNYLHSSYCITVVSEEHLDVKLPNHFMYISANSFENITNLMLNASEMGCSDYIVQMSDPEIFMNAFENVVHMGNVRRSDRKIIILPLQSADSNSKKQLLSILFMKEVSFVANILLVIPSDVSCDCETYDLLTHKFVGLADHSTPIYLDKWNSCTRTFEKNENLFPHDMSNLYGKTVRAAGFTYKLYILLDLDPTIVPEGRDGMDVRIINEFCRWINCTIELVRNDEHQWGEIYDNLTGVGVLGNVVEDKADLGITALYSWYDEFVVMDFSAPYIRTGVTCIAPSPSLLPSWMLPLLPFTLYMWIALFFTFIFASIALIVVKKFETDKVFLITFGIMITQSQPESGFPTWRIRSVIGWMMIAGLVLDNAYGGGLASTFTVPKYEPTVDTIQDIVDRNLIWGATHDAWTFSLILSQEPRIKKLVSLYKTYPADELERQSFIRNIAFGIEKLPAGTYAIGEYITKEASLDYTIMLEEFYFEQCIMMMRKSSAYTNKLSDLIGRLHESGLLLAWENQIALQYLDYKVQLAVKLSRSKKDIETVEPLALRHVQGIFFIYVVGVVVSLLALGIEVLVHRNK